MAFSGWDDYYVGSDFDELDFDDEIELPMPPESEYQPTTHKRSEKPSSSQSSTSKKRKTNNVNDTDKTTNETATGAKALKTKKKSSKKQRPPMKFTQENATAWGTELVSNIFETMPKHEEFKATFCRAKQSLAIAERLVTFKNTPVFMTFCTFFMVSMWAVVTAADNNLLKSSEILVEAFHELRTSQILIAKWDTFLTDLDIVADEIFRDIVLQHLLEVVLERLIMRRNSEDLPAVENVFKSSDIDKDGQQVLGYIAGFVPFALLKHYKKQKNNSTALKYVAILQNWKISGPYERQYSFLEYAREWIAMQSRGRLYHPQPHVFLFFRGLENESRKHLNTRKLDNLRDISVRDLLLNKMKTSFIIQKYWQKLIAKGDLSCTENTHLFHICLQKYVDLRCRAFATVFNELKKLSDKSVSKKGEKSLRKSLATDK